MIEYEFELPQIIPVERVFNYTFRKLGGECTQYGGSACCENIKGDTFLAILGEAKEQKLKYARALNRLYHVNPHAGFFATVTNERTNHVTITPIEGQSLDESVVKEIQKELLELRDTK